MNEPAPGRRRIQVDVVVDAPPEAVWAAVTDWERQSEWMLGTTVRATDHGGVGVGGGIEAFTGLGRLGPSGGKIVEEGAKLRHQPGVVRVRLGDGHRAGPGLRGGRHR